ncbi:MULTISPECIES: CRISPR-associated endonuclease Cas2 [unclassified Psychrobacter]|uniref:CRISPR-associated endonuclease Cas2 n=1 Tax=unclassified Psychrobacter TaxID=196806 RepID=UPI0015E60781|nr:MULTISPECIES: CRISPR-associated endonuclease Cas2 [unclassified Psychrobacter]MBA2058652.1 CRISPR-associated endonuclease Cas2 [Psychrobacter sp. D2]|tara:strand:- start:461 stop:751 length:291 start_codon:yes stop_codon:yes gene_type:complete
MMVLVTYDICSEDANFAKRLRHVAKHCLNFGQRVQYSVFEIEVNPAEWATLKAKLEDIINHDVDSLRYYYLGKNWRNKVEHIGAKPVLDLNDVLLF